MIWVEWDDLGQSFAGRIVGFVWATGRLQEPHTRAVVQFVDGTLVDVPLSQLHSILDTGQRKALKRELKQIKSEKLK